MIGQVAGPVARRNAPPSTVTASIVLTSIPSPATAAVARDIVRTWLCVATDVKIDNAWGVLQYSTIPMLYRKVRGRWWVSLVEQSAADTYVQVTRPVQLSDPATATFVLGSPITKMTVGRSIHVQVEYEAASATAGEPVFWSGASQLNVTVNMV